MLQMVVTGTIKNYVVAWTHHEIIIDEIYYNDFNSGVQWKINFKNIMSIFFKFFSQWVQSCFYLATLLFDIKAFEA